MRKYLDILLFNCYLKSWISPTINACPVDTITFAVVTRRKSASPRVGRRRCQLRLMQINGLIVRSPSNSNDPQVSLFLYFFHHQPSRYDLDNPEPQSAVDVSFKRQASTINIKPTYSSASAPIILHCVWTAYPSAAPLRANPSTPILRTMRSPSRLTNTPVRSVKTTLRPYDNPLVMLTRCGLCSPPAPSALRALYIPGPQKKTPVMTAACNLFERCQAILVGVIGSGSSRQTRPHSHC